jgi:hypothetical protein
MDAIEGCTIMVNICSSIEQFDSSLIESPCLKMLMKRNAFSCFLTLNFNRTPSTLKNLKQELKTTKYLFVQLLNIENSVRQQETNLCLRFERLFV